MDAMGRRPRWMLARVSGPSMVPTLRHGDLVVADRRRAVTAGSVVLARFRALPDRVVVKRAARLAGDGWWLASDNRFAGGDSSAHGAADVIATVRWVLRPGRLPRRLDGGAHPHE